MLKLSVYIKTILSNRYGGTALIYFLSMIIAFLVRCLLLVKAHDVVQWNVSAVTAVFAWGALYDLAAASYLSLPVVVYLVLLPDSIFSGRFHRRLSAVFLFFFLFGLLFVAAAEYLFWDEFGTRFNFIAVDYLEYPAEVFGNIRESYPLLSILGGLLLVSGLLCWRLCRRKGMMLWQQSRTPWKIRLVRGSGLMLLPLIFTLTLDNRMVSGFDNKVNAELARNGLYALGAAFRNNEMDYGKFYETMNHREAFLRLRRLLKTDNSTFISNVPEDIARWVENPGEEKRYNVIQITVESLSAEYMGAFGSRRNLTPHLDEMAARGILFTRFHATGTRTVRGMEALTLSLPPTPGRSIIKRSHNENLFSLGALFKNRGYDTVFLYSGHGSFDNMDYFFSHNGYRVVDRNAVPEADVTFANIWGACDEDLYNWVLKEADHAHASGRPFYHFVMTTSNHRPYSYPEGKIDIPSHTGRDGAVKYSDYAIGAFIRKAQARPWFGKTVFVIVADHCANNGSDKDGRAALSLRKYEIPLIIYNPIFFRPEQVDTYCSQVDYAPTLLGLLNWSYQSRFYGKDVFRMKKKEERVLLGNYQKLGLMTDERLVVLEPVRRKTVYHYDDRTRDLIPIPGQTPLVNDAIACYQTAGYLFTHRLNSAKTE